MNFKEINKTFVITMSNELKTQLKPEKKNFYSCPNLQITRGKGTKYYNTSPRRIRFG